MMMLILRCAIVIDMSQDQHHARKVAIVCLHGFCFPALSRQCRGHCPKLGRIPPGSLRPGVATEHSKHSCFCRALPIIDNVLCCAMKVGPSLRQGGEAEKRLAAVPESHVFDPTHEPIQLVLQERPSATRCCYSQNMVAEVVSSSCKPESEVRREMPAGKSKASGEEPGKKSRRPQMVKESSSSPVIAAEEVHKEPTPASRDSCRRQPCS